MIALRWEILCMLIALLTLLFIFNSYYNQKNIIPEGESHFPKYEGPKHPPKSAE
ncbi:hypothetical protein BH09BAC1_BH09BAC1_17830 [soil metagenome]